MADNDKYAIVKGDSENKVHNGYMIWVREDLLKAKKEHEDSIADILLKIILEENKIYHIMPNNKYLDDFIESTKNKCKVYAKAVVDKIFVEDK